MKTKITLLASLMMLALGAFNARAIIVFQDNFSYAGQPIPLDGAGGFWVQGAGNVANNSLSISGNLVTWPGTSTADTPRAYFTNGITIVNGVTNAPGSPLINGVYYFPSNSTYAALYGSCTINLANSAGLGLGQYFWGLTDTNFTFKPRLFFVTNGAASGNYRIGIANTSTAPTASTNIVQSDLVPGTTYTVIFRYVLATGVSTVWVNPVNETDSASSVTAKAATAVTAGGSSGTSAAGVFIRNAGALNTLSMGNLIVATSFEEVYPSSAGQNPPFISTQPKDVPSIFEGNNATFSVVAGGDSALTYQWYYNTNQSPAWLSTNPSATTASLVLSNVVLAESGTYDVVITNLSGSVTSRFAVLSVSSVPVPPVITNQPASQTNVLLSTVSFGVTAGGSQPLDYYWKSVVGGVTNPAATFLNGGSSSTLTLFGVTNSASYFVTVSNQFGATNSVLAALTVIPPILTNIAYVRSTVDPVNYNPTNTTSLFKIRGIVTTWADMTTSGNTEFFIQDATGGIAVFWGNAPGATYLPPAGALVEVVAPVSTFNGLEEMAPVFGTQFHSVTVLSTGNPLPVPMPLPFDPAIINNVTNMELLEGSYFVATNVMLESDIGATFASISAGENITNAGGQTFNLFVNSHTDVVGQPKYTCPVDIYGILGQFDSSDPRSSGYQFTPGRYADIVPSVRFTNVLSNLNRRGDVPTNTFSDLVLRPGEKITMNLRATDPRSGSITAIGPFSGLPAAATHSVSLAAGVGTASFEFQATSADAGSNYAVNLVVTTPTWSSTNVWNVYVPTAAEQKIFIGEFLAFASGDSNSPAFNPLHRPWDTNNFGNDRYVEIANLSGSNIDLQGWSIGNGSATWHTFYNGSFGGETLNSSNCYVVYSGPFTDTTNPPTILSGQIESANPGPLGFDTTLGGVITLYKSSGQLIDRVAYSASDLVTNGCSNTRFLYPDGILDVVPQSYVSTNWVTPGAQWDGSAWNQTAKLPVNVGSITVTPGNPLTLHFTADPTTASTLWQLNSVSDPIRIVYGQQFTNTSGVFQITNPPAASQFYGVTKQ